MSRQTLNSVLQALPSGGATRALGLLVVGVGGAAYAFNASLFNGMCSLGLLFLFFGGGRRGLLG